MVAGYILRKMKCFSPPLGIIDVFECGRVSRDMLGNGNPKPPVAERTPPEFVCLLFGKRMKFFLLAAVGSRISNA